MKSVSYSKKTLTELLAINTTERVIKSTEQIAFYCFYCKEKEGMRNISQAVRCFKNNGFAYQCKDCFALKIKNRPQSWKDNVKKSLQSEEHKQRARDRNKQYIQKYKKDDLERIIGEFWEINIHSDFKKEDKVTCTCKECGYIDSKSLKKLMESSLNGKSGCGQCFELYTKTVEFSQKMSARSTKSGSEARRRQSINLIKHLASLTSEERKKTYGREKDPEWARQNFAKIRIEYKDKMLAATRKSNQSESKRAAQSKTLTETWSKVSPEEKIRRYDQVRATNLERYGHESAMQNPEIRKKAFAKKGPTKPEKYIFEMLTNRGFNFQYQCSINEKVWDFVIFEGDVPVLIIEIDGEFAHSLKNDNFFKCNGGVTDAERFSKMPDGVKFIVADSLNIKKVIPEIIDALDLHYYDWIESIFADCILEEFPYPEYTDKRMLYDWSNLKRAYETKDYNTQKMPANSLMTRFHPSLYHNHLSGKISPYDAWSDPVLLWKCIENRFVYKSQLSTQQIARGFEKNKLAPRVTVFQPAHARYLLQKYGGEFETVIDPFSGFSGRMLGTL
jgi:hypothetical protein